MREQKKAAKNYFKLKLKNYENKLKPIDYHGYLVGLIAALRVKIERKYSGLIIITGTMGDGKSSLIEGLLGMYHNITEQPIVMENIQWRTEKINKVYDNTENHDTGVWWDELIQAGGNRGKQTKDGASFKMKYVTKRYKKHLLLVAIDSLANVPDYLVDYADAWIHVEAPYWSRGFFRATTRKPTIKYAYDLFHKFKKNWGSPEVQKLRFECMGQTQDFSGFFIDPKQYDEHKEKETSELEENEKSIVFEAKHLKAFELRCKGSTYQEIANLFQVDRKTATSWINKVEVFIANMEE